MEKEQFQKLPIEYKLPIINMHQNLLKDAIYNRMALLPMTAGLSATLLVVATFNDKLIPLDNFVRFIISVLLLIIPFSLYFYNFDLKKAQRKNKEYLDHLLDTSNKKIESTLNDKIAGYAPDFIIYIMGIVSIAIIFKIWDFHFCDSFFAYVF